MCRSSGGTRRGREGRAAPWCRSGGKGRTSAGSSARRPTDPKRGCPAPRHRRPLQRSPPGPPPSRRRQGDRPSRTARGRYGPPPPGPRTPRRSTRPHRDRSTVRGSGSGRPTGSEITRTTGRWRRSGSAFTLETTASSCVSRMTSVPTGYTPVAVISTFTSSLSKPLLGLSRISCSTASGGQGSYW